MRFFLCFVTITLLVLLSSITGFAQNVYPLADTSITYRLDAEVAISIDPSDSLSIDDVSTASFEKNFKRSKSNLTFGYLKSTIWLKLKTKTRSLKTNWYLEIPAPFLEYVDFYQWNNQHWHHSESGYYRAHNVREISHTGHVTQLIFGEDSLNTIYIRIAGRSPKTFPLRVVEQQKFNELVRFEDIGYGLFFGILIAMFFFNLFIFLTLKQINYLLYICTVVCTFLIFASASGYGGKFLWPNSPTMNFYAGRMTLGAMGIFLSIFTMRFLEVKKYSRVMYYLLLSLIPLAVIANILTATNTVSSAGNNLISICTVMYMATGIVCSIKGNKTAYYFIAAWAIYLIGGLMLTLRNSGVFDFSFWTTHFVEIGAVMETTIIGFALGDRYRRYKQEKEEAQALALKIQMEATVKLEEKVAERTIELSNAYEELRSTLETNKLQTKIIENKNAELDAFFYRISHDLRGPISSLLGLSILAKMDVKDEQARDYIEKQHYQVERLNHIITGLINLTKLSHTELQKQQIDFERLTSDCIASFQALENFGRIEFFKEIEDNVAFFSEWTLLNAILQNLIENGIKYARRQSAFIKINIRYESKFMIMTVQDNGQGIPPAYQARIFEMFYRATQDANGTGLGLYILKRSVDRLQGTVDVVSELGVGSTFTVKIPSL
jgi:signal transduction histidine kinase